MISFKKPGTPEELVHHGVKGMHWGVRREGPSGSGTSKGKFRSVLEKGGGIADTGIFALSARTETTHNKIVDQASKKMKQSLPDIKARHGEYGKLSNRAKKPFSKEARAYRKDVKETYLKHLEDTANSMTNTKGTWRYTLKENGKPNTSQYLWQVSLEQVQHADSSNKIFSTVRPIFDSEGWIIDVKKVDDMSQTMERGKDFLIHMGIDV